MSSRPAKINEAIHDLASDATDIANAPDPATRAQAAGKLLERSVPNVQTAAREIRQAAVAELRTQGLSYAEIGAAIGVTRARAKQILEGKSQNARARRASRAEAEAGD